MSDADLNSEGRASARPKLNRDASQQPGTCRSTSLRNEDIGRKRPIHLAPLEAHNRPIIIFVTACTKHRQKILANREVHAAIVRAWQRATTWLVGRYVILPDHLHLFCAPNLVDPPSLERWIRYWKSLTTRSLEAGSETVWQRHHWDRQLRAGESYDGKWDYVRNNPVRHGLVTCADDWPYQGELNELRW